MTIKNKCSNVLMFQCSNDKGFTLIELLVSLSILTVAILAALGIYINVIGTRQKTLGQLNIQEDGQYLMSLIVKDIRAGIVDYDNYGSTKDCGIIDVDTKKAGDDGSTVAKLCLLDFSATSDEIRYKICPDPDDATRGELKRCKAANCATNNCPASGDDYQTITMTNISFERLDFYINPTSDPFTAGSTTYEHPRVTVLLKLRSLREKPGEKELILQQTVPQRYTYRK